MNTLEERLERIESMLMALVERHQPQEWYAVDAFSKIVRRSTFTVREWCRLGRIEAVKQGSGRGKYMAWSISHEELQRYQREGLRLG